MAYPPCSPGSSLAGVALSRSDEREIVNHRRLEHPNVLGFREVFLCSSRDARPAFEGDEVDARAHERHLVVVTEHAGGGTLRDLVDAGGPLGEAAARSLFRQLCEGLAHCHSRGVVHRALCVDTLLLTGRCGAQLPPAVRRSAHTSRGPVCLVNEHRSLVGHGVRVLSLLPKRARRLSAQQLECCSAAIMPDRSQQQAQQARCTQDFPASQVAYNAALQ